MSVGQKPILVIFEGVDKSGKTTLKDAFNKCTNFKYVVLDRFTTSSKVYARLFNRDGIEYYDEVENKIIDNFNVLVICCVSQVSDIENRLKKANETLPEELRDIEKVQEMFVEEVSELKARLRRLYINTSTCSIDCCVRYIIDAVNYMEEFG